jgi:multidrug efflux pump subunit AcrA (membrane-fusion protein)
VPGLFARVRVPISAPQKALLVSERAIGTDQSQKFVLAVTAENKLAYRMVKIGPMIDGLRVVRSGVEAGETIVVNGFQRARPGITIEPEWAVATNDPRTANAPAVAAR